VPPLQPPAASLGHLHISKNTCELLNQSVMQTKLQTEMQTDMDALMPMRRSNVNGYGR
jgi:hypothetical protein